MGNILARRLIVAMSYDAGMCIRVMMRGLVFRDVCVRVMMQGLIFQDVCVDIKDKRILWNVSGHTPSGAVLAVMGPSGRLL